MGEVMNTRRIQGLARYAVSGLLMTCLGFVSALTADEPAKKPGRFTLDDLTKYTHLTDVQVSPDGRSVLYVAERETDISPMLSGRESTIWFVRSGGEPRPVTTGGHGSKPRWSPDGKSIAFLLQEAPSNPPKPGGPATTLRVGTLDAAGAATLFRETKQVTPCGGGPLVSFSWAPDGRHLAFLCSRLPAPPDPKAMAEDPERDIIVASHSRYFDAPAPSGDTGARQTLELLDLVSGQVDRADLTTGGRSLLVTDGFNNATKPLLFSRDGNTIFLCATEDASVYAMFSPNRGIYRVSLGSAPRISEAAKIPGSDGPATAPSLSRDGRTLSWIQYGGHFPDKLGSPVLRTFDLKEASASARSIALPDFILSFHTDPAPIWSSSGQVYLLGLENAGWRLFAIDPATGRRTPASPENRHMTAFSVAADGTTMAAILGDANSPDEIFLRAGASTTFVSLTHFGDAVRQWLAFSPVQSISWPSKDGKFEVRGFLVKPPDYQPGKRYPLIVDIHGGPGVYYVNQFYAVRLGSGGAQVPAELYAAHGFAVLCPNPRGDSAYTMAYAQPGMASWEGKISDVIAGAETLVTRGIADPKRLGVTGGSFGGWGSVYAISKTNIFKAAASHDGPLDMTTEMGLEYRRGLLSNWNAFSDVFGGTPHDVPFPEINPSTIRTPVLLRFGAQPSDPVHSESFYDSGMGVYAYLDCHGLPVEMLVHPHESHGIFNPKTLRDYVERNLNWFEYWLNDAPYRDEWRREEFDAWKKSPGHVRPCGSAFER
jgi:dipeptidyl aminopeptidase/acylaminoacyl peptidase